jgi:hypothetical protein
MPIVFKHALVQEAAHSTLLRNPPMHDIELK